MYNQKSVVRNFDATAHNQTHDFQIVIVGSGISTTEILLNVVYIYIIP